MVKTKKDFIQQAKLLKSIRSDSVRRRLTNAQIKIFKKSNSRFDEKKFRDFINK